MPILLDGKFRVPERKILAQGVLTSTEATIYTVPAGAEADVPPDAFVLVSISGNTTRKVTIWVVPSGETPGDKHKVRSAEPLSSRSVVLGHRLLLGAGSVIRAVVDAPGSGDVALTIMGTETRV